MKTTKSPIFLLILILLASSMACSLIDSLLGSPPQVQETGPAEANTSLTPIYEQEPDPTDEVEEPTVSQSNRGQIIYTHNGNIWRYLVDTSITIQVTFDGVADSDQGSYGEPQLSHDGRNLAYKKNDVSYIHNLEGGNVTNLNEYGKFLQWAGEGGQFFIYKGDFQCPAVENLDDQKLINFDIYRMDIDALDTPEFLANIGGGLRFLQAMSKDGQWASVTHCGCYSECGSNSLWHLPSNTVMQPSVELFNGDIAFSPDSLYLAVSEQQIYGYHQSPLYIANIDFSGIAAIFSEPNTAPERALWSPTGEWIAVTVLSFDGEGYTPTDSRVILLHPDGNNQLMVDGNFANLFDWSPDGKQLLYLRSDASSKTLYIYDLETGLKSQLPFLLDEYFYTQMDWGRLP